MAAYCKNRDILISHKDYVECHTCSRCLTLNLIGDVGYEYAMETMNKLIEDYKQRLREKKLKRVLDARILL